jgi:predicted amidohydrolase YtcJ
VTQMTVYRNGRVYSPAAPSATAVAVVDGRITWLGPDSDAPTGDRVLDLAGALVTPAFVDAHVHCTGTGTTLTGLDLSGARSRDELLDALAAHAKGTGPRSIVIGHGWDESGWPDRVPPDMAALDRAGGGRRVYLSQASAHSAVVSSALLAAVPQAAAAPGFDASGWLRLDAHHAVRAVAMDSFGATQRRQAQRAALRHAASLGIASVHECGGPHICGEDDFTGLLGLSADGGLPEVYGYWGELGSAVKAREIGAVGAGGDLFADGALGSRTAHLRESYVDDAGAGRGHGYLSAGQVAEHVVDCVRNGIQAGFHAIGDAAIATVLAGFAAASATVGLDRLRAGRHRIEHAEILDQELIRGLVEYAVTASVQPAFDRLWGGETGMYAQRLGARRSLAANPIAAMAGVGVALAFGSDSPITPLDPWGAVRAAMTHHHPPHRLGVRAAFGAHTRGGWRALGVGGRGSAGSGRSEPRSRDRWSNEGVLAPGAPATFAVWGVPCGLGPEGLPVLSTADPDDPPPALPTCHRTVLRGHTIFERGAGAP